MAVPTEKIALPTPPAPAPAASSSILGSVASPFTSLYSRFSNWKSSFDLPNPGTAENLQKEVKRERASRRVVGHGNPNLDRPP